MRLGQDNRGGTLEALQCNAILPCIFWEVNSGRVVQLCRVFLLLSRGRVL